MKRVWFFVTVLGIVCCVPGASAQLLSVSSVPAGNPALGIDVYDPEASAGLVKEEIETAARGAIAAQLIQQYFVKVSGDINADGEVNITDAIVLLQDTSIAEEQRIADALEILNFLFNGGPAPTYGSYTIKDSNFDFANRQDVSLWLSGDIRSINYNNVAAYNEDVSTIYSWLQNIVANNPASLKGIDSLHTLLMGALEEAVPYKYIETRTKVFPNVQDK